jgi:hypothetical protein
MNDPKYTGQEFKVIGSRVKRPDGIDKVTGRARYMLVLKKLIFLKLKSYPV